MGGGGCPIGFLLATTFRKARLMSFRTKKLPFRSFALLPVVGMAAALIMLGGCDLTRNYTKIDRSGDKEVQDYRDALAPRLPELTESVAPADSGIPALQAYVMDPSDNLKPMPMVSVSVNQTVPLRDVLFELAKQADYDLELDPRISGSIIFTARDRPLDEVVKRISDIAGLRYSFENDVLRVEMDEPFNETYKIDYLSYIRKNKGSIRNNISVVSGEGTDTGSGYEASGESEANFWGELESGLQQILGVRPAAGNLKTSATPQITAADPNPAPVQPVVAPGADGQPQVQVQPPSAVLQVTSLPVDAASTEEPAKEGTPSFSLNKQAGIISVFASERQQEQVREYLKLLKRSVTSQVLIEAKVMEVSLTDEFSAGIDWGLLNLFNGKGSIALDVVGQSLTPALDPAPAPTVDFKAAYVDSDFQAAVQAVSRFGAVHALASPRLTVLNNQSAVLNVANNQVYFEVKIDVTTQDNVTQTNVDSTIKNVPEGVLINVQPSIDLDNHSISMAIRPTITRIVDFVDDPSVQFVTAANNIQGVQSRVPVVNVQEMDSVVKMNSGQAIIMGGLMQDRSNATQVGMPVLSEVPVLGTLFRNQGDSISKTELVIFLKATILDGDTGVSETDRDLYKEFSGDRRPWKI